MNEKKMVGKRSVLFSRPPIIIGAGSVAGEKEGNGAFGKCFDMVEEDPLFGGKTWEEAESKMQQLATRIALRKAGARAAGNPLFSGRRFAWTVNCHFFWYHEFQYPDVWCIWRMFNDGRVSGDWSDAR